MSATPPPFGDPTNIRRENQAAIGKGIAVGCGGCLTVVAVGVFFVVALTGLIFYVIRNSDTNTETLRRAQASPALIQQIGEPIQMGWLVMGTVSRSNETGDSDMSVPVIGPKGSARIHTVGVRDATGWHYSKMMATLENGQQIDLLQPPQAQVVTPGTSTMD
jgi:hypothetical protein